MCRTHHNLYTKQQLQGLFAAWGCSEPIPDKGMKVVIAFGGKQGIEADLIEVERTDLKGTYGDRLYRTTTSSRDGRAFDVCVQEAHVMAFARHQAEERRRQNLARHHAALALSEAADTAADLVMFRISRAASPVGEAMRQHLKY